MHKVIVARFVSLDGVVEDPDGSSEDAGSGVLRQIYTRK
jgi:hypothetical protein